MPEIPSAPDWVVIGSPSRDPHGRFVVYASTDLSEGELRRQVAVEYDNFDRVQSKESWTEVFIRMNQFVIVFGGSYAECWRTLADVWSPEGPPTPPTPQIEAGHVPIQPKRGHRR